jgi:hypothetical protein
VIGSLFEELCGELEADAAIRWETVSRRRGESLGVLVPPVMRTMVFVIDVMV